VTLRESDAQRPAARRLRLVRLAPALLLCVASPCF
jgi:hypothetical protein